MSSFSKTEAREFLPSVFTAIRSMANGKQPEGLAAEVSEDARQRQPAEFGSALGLYVPLRGLNQSRALVTNTYASGGALGPWEEQGDVQQFLQPFSAVVASGAQVFENLSGNISFGRESTTTTFSWTTEDGTISESTPQFKKLTLTPHRVAGACSISDALNAQSDIARFLPASLGRGLGAALDTAILEGSGASGMPLGVMNSAAVNVVDFSGAAATLAKASSFIEQCSSANCDDNALTWICHPAVRSRWRAVQAIASTDLTLYSHSADMILGKPAKVTTACGATHIACGDWSQIAVGTWGETAFKLTINPYSQSLSGRITFVASMLADCGPLQPATITVSSSSAVV
jgi:HK97 family phage major capsid protein